MTQHKQIMGEHVCVECYYANKGYLMLNNGKKICKECGGLVLTTQEAGDMIADLHVQVRTLEGEYE